ncbi:MAG: 16S rRNA (guanine(527)-N(7))-methyltransferase RsmG [Anaerolineae bacterium]
MKTLRDVAGELGVGLDLTQLEMFQTYYEELIDWNQRVNLTALTDYEEVQIKHFADSLAVLLALATHDLGERPSLVDIGSGAGFPGLPLKIARPAWRVVLVESTRKKTAFLEHIIDQLGLQETDVVWARAEKMGRGPAYREQFDIAVARAVADLAVLVEYALPLLRVGGRFIAQKGADPSDELRAAVKSIDVLGGAYHSTVAYRLPAFDEPLHLVVIEKVSPTPEKYPRRPGMAAKRPIG